MTKSQWRIKYRELRESLSAKAIEEQSIAIANNALKMDIWEHENYHIFLPIPGKAEVDTEFLMSVLSGKDKNIILSQSDFKTCSMTHYLLTDGTRIKPNAWGIPEPQNGLQINEGQIDVVFVPLLAYDIWGNRLGYGKGFYDRFLHKCRKDVLRIGLSFFEPEGALSVNNDDMGLTHCITGAKIHSF